MTGAAGVPGNFIVSPTGTEQINVVGNAPTIETIYLRQARDASGYQLVTQAATNTVQVGDDVSVLVLTGAVSATSATVTLPVNPVDGQTVLIFSRAGITTLTMAVVAGQALDASFAAALAANGNIQFLYNLATTTWFRIS